MKWFRFYTESLHHPKVQRLPAPIFKQWVNLLCLAAQEERQGRLPSRDDIGYHLGITAPQVHKLVSVLADSGLLDLDDDSTDLFVHNWMDRQPRSGSTV